MEVLVEDLVQWRCTRTCTTGLAMLFLSSWPPPFRTLPLAPSCIEVDPPAMYIWLLRNEKSIKENYRVYFLGLQSSLSKKDQAVNEHCNTVSDEYMAIENRVNRKFPT